LLPSMFYWRSAHLQTWVAVLQSSTCTGGGTDVGQVTISNTIRRFRFETDEMTQKDLAEKVGVTRQTIVAIENAKYSPTLELAFRISAVFGVPLHEVFTYHGAEAET
jgi:putative transcriptional regulator